MTIDDFAKELRKDSEINKHKLDEECVKQTFLYSKWSIRLAKAQERLRKIELMLTQFKATQYIHGKKSKITDKLSESKYRTNSRYTELSKRKYSAMRSVELFQSAVYSMMNRRAMIESLVKLNSNDYYNET